MSWYLQVNGGTPRSFSALGCSGLKRELRSQAPGRFTFRLNLQQMDTAPIAAYNDLAQVLWIDGNGTVPSFAGRVTKAPVAGETGSERQDYEISDPWSDFEKITYQVQWNRITVDEHGTPSTAAQYSACCLLGQALNGSPMSSGAVIRDAVTWAIARDANCRLGQILMNGDASVDSPIPVDEVTDLPVSEIIKRMLRFTPDAVTWFDFTQTPPVFNITRQAQCRVVNLPFTGAGDAVDITPRNDLVRPQVLLRYEQPNVTDGQTYMEIYLDAAGTPTVGTGAVDGLAFGALVSTVRLAGGNATFQKQPITTTPIPQGADDANAVPFLQLNHGWLRAFSPDRLQVNSLSVAVDNPGGNGQNDDAGTAITDFNVADYPNQLLTGTICKWMQQAYPTLKAARVTVTAQLSYIYPDTPDAESDAAYLTFGPAGGNLRNFNNNLTILTGVKGTNAVQQIYEMLSDYTAPEAPPTGLAAVLYSALSTLQYEGTWNVIQDEPAPSTALGCVMNLTGSQQAWGAMNALVQEITDDLDKGSTAYKFGPARELTIQDLMEQLRATRRRILSSKIKERQTGQPDADLVNGAGHTGGPGHDNSGPAPTAYPFIDFIDETDDDSGNPETWDALFGYGQSTFAGSDGIDHTGPLESFELSVGNDGSAWPSNISSVQSGLTNALSLISGNDDPSLDQLFIGTAGGSLKLQPDTPQLVLTAQDTSTATLNKNSLALVDHSSGGSITIDASATSGKAMSIQTLSICVGSETKSILVLASDPF